MKVIIKNEEERLGSRCKVVDMPFLPRVGDSFTFFDADEVAPPDGDTGNPRYVVTDVEHQVDEVDVYLGFVVYVINEEQ